MAFTRSTLSSSWWGGETRAGALADVLARPIATGDQSNGPFIPELVYVLFEGMFASFTYVQLLNTPSYSLAFVLTVKGLLSYVAEP